MTQSGHHIAVSPVGATLRVLWRGREIARTDQALDLKEGSSPAVRYFPRDAVSPSLLERTTRTTRCPFKGEANYFSLVMDGARDDNAIWTYESPIPAAAAIKDHLAFYPDKVTIETV